MNDVLAYLEQMYQIPLFEGIQKGELLPMIQCLNAYVKEYKKEENIYLYDDSVQVIGIILSGNVHMIQEDLWGNKAILVNISKGELFGETFVCGNKRAASVSFITTKNTVVLFLPFDRVLHSCAKTCTFHHRLIQNMVVQLADKNIQLMNKIDAISKGTLREKIATYLTNIAEEQACLEFEIPLGRVQLAEYLHADRSAITRELNAMQQEGLIEFERNHFQILRSLVL